MSEDRSDYGAMQVMRPEAPIEAMERAQIDMQIATAKRYPRDLHKVKQDMLSLATLDQETAEACFYSVPRGGKTIQGPGVRLAEIAVHSFGNIRVQTRVIATETEGKTPHCTVQAVCADLEKNVAVSIEKRRRIVGKKSNAGRIDEDDINLAVNACGAIAFRDAAFKVIPGALVKSAFDAAKKVAIGDAKTLEVRRSEAFTRLAKMGVPEKRVLATLEKKAVESVDLADLETLFGLFTAIKDGQTSIEQAFPIVGPTVATPQATALADQLAGKKAEDPKKPEPPTPQKKTGKKPEPKKEEPPATAPEPAEQTDAGKAADAEQVTDREFIGDTKEYSPGRWRRVCAKLNRDPNMDVATLDDEDAAILALACRSTT